ncbi:probable E3 ubiquitin-protein ligase HERC4 isoform X2 [Planococcus citri]|uniref:probable E3 ubiquitin-protein ligase HERC4 isoform X2 n=1 Tax=Planococcus citri TaxID=170843 RepID=UPI0031F77533
MFFIFAILVHSIGKYLKTMSDCDGGEIEGEGSVTTSTNECYDDKDTEDVCRLNSSMEWRSIKSPFQSFVYGWGNTVDGELGLGGIEENHILEPREVTFHDSENIKHVACGEHHSLVLTCNGMVYSCGNNDYGQLGRDKSRTKKFHKVSGLDVHNIINIACGEHHSIAVNEWGQVFSWGSNLHGQLGFSDNLGGFQPEPKIIKTLATKNVVQVSCGYKHCLALTNDGTLYSWGLNDNGQLGLGLSIKNVGLVSQPNVVKALNGVPIAFIACGGYHSFAISKTGVVYGWGKNSFGQLGLNNLKNHNVPSQLRTLRSVKIKYISCGEDFSVFLTQDGGVFTCGAGMYGQLGHGAFTNEVLPRKVVELMGSTVTQISCGRRHTLTMIPSRGRVYAFGLGGVGQLGNKFVKNASTPHVVLGPWATSSDSSSADACTVRRVYSGGDHCFVTVAKKKDNLPPEDLRIWPKNTQILDVDFNYLNQCRNIPVDSAVDQDLMTYLELVMSSLSCFNGSFLVPDTECCEQNASVDFKMVAECFNIITKIEHPSILDTILTCISTMVMSFPSTPIDVETSRAYLILPLYHQFLNPKNCDILQIPFGEGLLQTFSTIEKWYKTLNSENFELLILIYKNVLIDKLKTLDPSQELLRWDSMLSVSLEVLSKLNALNKCMANRNISSSNSSDTSGRIVSTADRSSTPTSSTSAYEKHGGCRVPYHAFYVPELSEHVNITVDYMRWVKGEPKSKYYFCDFPFIFDTEAKTTLLLTDQHMQMQNAVETSIQRAVMRTLFEPSGPTAISQFLDIHVSRDNIVQDTIRELSIYDTTDLKKPLRVHFLGEEAEDAGGVRKEFFMLVLRDILDPKYGMFQSYEETNTIWFRDDTFEDDTMYYLIGILCGLAIYNFTIINIPFPLAMYKKLLNEPVRLEDVKGLSPTLHKSLEDVLSYNEPDLEDVFSLHFDITRDVFGEIKVIPLKPNGENISVTLENKQEFVDLYVDMIFNKLVESRFKQFSAGFHKVCGGRVLQLFHAQELMSVVIGNEDYDWYQLENSAIYKKGYSSSDPTIRMFWEVFHEMSLEDKKKFLLYLTGSDRIPIQGMKAIKIVIQPTADDKYLPVAHTCFNLLDLPRYQTKERLRYKLLQAIQQTQGFSLV